MIVDIFLTSIFGFSTPKGTKKWLAIRQTTPKTKNTMLSLT